MAAVIAAAIIAGGTVSAGAREAKPASWRAKVTAQDRARIRTWRTAWTAATRGLRPAELAPYGALFEPDRSLPNPLPAPGEYRCRTFKLGAKATGSPGFVAYPAFRCSITERDGVLDFRKDDGSQRPVGRIFDDGAPRAIFLGTLVLGDEKLALDYGQDRSRDMAGIVQRVGERRWRMTLPYPAFESLTDVIELEPVG